MKKLFLFFILSFHQYSFADIYLPETKIIEESFTQKSCESKMNTEKLFGEIYKFYKSIDDDIPGITPEKRTYYEDELKSKNNNRIVEISSDPNYQVYILRERIKNLSPWLIGMTNVTGDKKTDIKFNLLTTINILEQLDYINLSEFEYIYENSPGLKKSNGILIKIISNQVPSYLYKYMYCSVKKMK